MSQYNLYGMLWMAFLTSGWTLIYFCVQFIEPFAKKKKPPTKKVNSAKHWKPKKSLPKDIKKKYKRNELAEMLTWNRVLDK